VTSQPRNPGEQGSCRGSGKGSFKGSGRDASITVQQGIVVFNCLACPNKKIGGIPNSRNVLFLQIFLKRAAKPRAGNTSARFP